VGEIYRDWGVFKFGGKCKKKQRRIKKKKRAKAHGGEKKNQDCLKTCTDLFIKEKKEGGEVGPPFKEKKEAGPTGGGKPRTKKEA